VSTLPSSSAVLGRDSRLLSTADAAAYVGRSEDYVRRVIKHECPHHQRSPRGPLFFWSSDLDRWLDRYTASPVGGGH